MFQPVLGVRPDSEESSRRTPSTIRRLETGFPGVPSGGLEVVTDRDRAHPRLPGPIKGRVSEVPDRSRVQ